MQPQKKSVMELSPQGLAWRTLPSGAMYTMMVVLLNPVKLDSETKKHSFNLSKT